MTLFSSFQLFILWNKSAIGFRGTQLVFSEVRILRGKNSNIFSFQTMKVRFSNICQVKIERGTQFGRVLIAITFISTELPLAAKEWNWISQMSFSKNELIPIYLKARQNELLHILQSFSDAYMLNLGFENIFQQNFMELSLIRRKYIHSLCLTWYIVLGRLIRRVIIVSGRD